MENKNTRLETGNLLKFLGAALSLFWAFDFVFNIHLPFFIGFITVGAYAYGDYLVKSQRKTEGSNSQGDSNHQ